jgi:hypothetical protein
VPKDEMVEHNCVRELRLQVREQADRFSKHQQESVPTNSLFYLFRIVTEGVNFADPGSGAFLTLDPRSGIDFFRNPDPKTIFLIPH